jgi:hypothetical protein
LDEKQLKSVAYHEAGHIVVAAAQGLPLRKTGLWMDQDGNGEACYKMKEPDGSNDVGPDACRERTIIATCAGEIAQRKFAPEYPVSVPYDSEQIRKLMEEMYPRRDVQHIHRTELYERSSVLVAKHWRAIEAIAEAIWNKEPRRMEGEEVIFRLGQCSPQIEAVLDEPAQP